jgi:hypothetical protein
MVMWLELWQQFCVKNQYAGTPVHARAVPEHMHVSQGLAALMLQG